MAGIDDLHQLLSGMEPELHEGEFVFCTFANGNIADLATLEPIGMFREAEGVTLILPREIAECEGLAGAPMRMITLTVHSSLEAVGLTAAFATRLAREGIGANVVAAFHHDHIFVPAADAEKALAALEALQRENAKASANSRSATRWPAPPGSFPRSPPALQAFPSSPCAAAA